MPDNNDIWKEYRAAVLSKLSYQEIFGQIKNQKEGTEGWVTGLCPFHDDQHPSFAFNKKTLVWNCFSGCGKGSAFDFIMQTSGSQFINVLLELGNKLGVPRPFPKKVPRPPIREELIKKWESYLDTDEELKHYLIEQRGLSDETIKKYQIGWNPKKQRYSIPIIDEEGNIVNVRLYSSKNERKIINYVDKKHKYGSPARLYGLDELIKSKEKQAILVEGEWDRLLMQQEGFVAITGTHGCSTFRSEWVNHFNGKDVVVIYDCDNEGQSAAKNIILKVFQDSEINSIKNVLLPLNGDKEDKDITDFFNKHGSIGADLQRLIDETPVHTYEEETGNEEEIIRLESFTRVEEEELIDKRIQCEITVCGETTEAFHAVKEFKVTYCSKQESGKCYGCRSIIKVPINSSVYIGSCMSSDVQVLSMLRAFCCHRGEKPTIEILERTTIKEFFCHQKVSRLVQTKDSDGNLIQYIDGKKQELMEKKVYYLSAEDVDPENFMVTGYIKTHPKTQQVTLLIETLERLEDDYQTFNLSKNILHLQAFQKISWEDKIVDLSENVTMIYQRDEILIAILLSYCSPLQFKFNKKIIRGWLTTLIIGDSGSGKTQSSTNFSEFVGIGDCFSGLTGSRTGLAYALAEHKQKGWQVKIGRYPANSRKILTIDETQHLNIEDLRTISKGMEDGFFQIDKVRSKGYECMTRLIMICNPKYDQVMDTYTFGCETLKGIFPSTMIRRVDLAIFANSGDIQDTSLINKEQLDPVNRKITPEMLRAVIFWAWNLKPDQIVIDREALLYCLAEADKLGNIYGDSIDVPLVPKTDIRKTLARIAVAIAVVELSANEDFTRLFVLKIHFQMAVEMLTRIYSCDSCALNTYSEIQKACTQLLDYDDIERAFLKKNKDAKHGYQNENIFPRAIKLLREKKIVRRDNLSELVGCTIPAISKIVKFLKRYEFVDTKKDGYIKTPKFNKFLRRFLKAHPDFLPKGSSPEPEDENRGDIVEEEKLPEWLDEDESQK